MSLNPKLGWYWRRLRAMSPGEMAAHVRKKARQKLPPSPPWEPAAAEAVGPWAFPILPSPAAAAPVLREALARDARDILAGRWKAFGHLDISVENPPCWQKDHLAGQNLESSKSSFSLSYRQHPGGADIKLIWEPSRWNQLARLAQAAWLLGDRQAAETCRAWLQDWTEHNAPFFGLNWTSALETGMRLIQFTWIDGLMEAAGHSVADLRERVLSPHMAYTWRFLSFGSSANNHLIGELAGLIVALARWPSLEKISAPLAELHQRFEREVLLQFAPDGGNREEALGYHQFSWEFCWQAQAALKAAGRTVDPAVTERLARAGSFYADLKRGPWDYGDSDNAFVTPFYCEETQVAEEWKAWFAGEASPGVSFWWGAPPRAKAPPEKEGWRHYADSGYALHASGDWTARWDMSALGYLATAAHGHLDALHVSLWHQGVPVVIDPGTGAYYANKTLRNYLASWSAHNGPCPHTMPFPERHGAFLWGTPHAFPALSWEGKNPVGSLALPEGSMRRKLVRLRSGWQVEDNFTPARGERDFQVHWQFPPGSQLKQSGERIFCLDVTGAGPVWIAAGAGWSKVEMLSPAGKQEGFRLEDLGDAPLLSVCSAAFRRVETGPCLLLTGAAQNCEGCWTRFSSEKEI